MTWRDRVQAGVEIGLMSLVIRLPRGVRVLEIGCGYGNALSELSRVTGARQMIGIDVDESALLKAAARSDSAAFSLAASDVARLPFSDGSIELIIDFGTLYHARN